MASSSSSFLRRSARNHKPPEASPPRLAKAKAAEIKWDEHPELVGQLISAMEANKRWRVALCQGNSPVDEYTAVRKNKETHRNKCLMEMATQFFSRNPVFGPNFRRKPALYAKAISDKLKELDPFCAKNHKSTSSSESNVPWRCSSCTHWEKRRQSYERQSGTIAAWQMVLPVEMQQLVAIHAIHEARDAIDIKTAAKLRSVNTAWREFIDPYFFRDVTITKEQHYEPLLGIDGTLINEGGAGKYVKTLHFHYLPDCFFPLEDEADIHVEEFHHDLSFMRKAFSNLELMSLRNRIELIARVCLPLYQQLVQTRAKTLRLTCDHVDWEPEKLHRQFWRDLLGAHLASLRLMDCCEGLTIDGQLYLQILPPIVSTWTKSPTWPAIVEVLRDQADEMSDGIMPTMLDDSNVKTLTFFQPDVPTLAILAAMSQGTQLETIQLVGWDSDESSMPEDWKAFLSAEKSRPPGPKHTNLRWIRSSGADL